VNLYRHNTEFRVYIHLQTGPRQAAAAAVAALRPHHLLPLLPQAARREYICTCHFTTEKGCRTVVTIPNSIANRSSLENFLQVYVYACTYICMYVLLVIFKLCI
jgi:hypothetical protein